MRNTHFLEIRKLVILSLQLAELAYLRDDGELNNVSSVLVTNSRALICRSPLQPLELPQSQNPAT